MTKQHGQSSPPPGVTVRREGEFTVYQKNDGFDYWDVLRRFRAGLLTPDHMENRGKTRDLCFLTVAGRRLVLKWERRREHRLEKTLFLRLFGPYHSRQMQRIRRAVDRGCRVAQDVFLVAERMEGGLSSEAFSILEYVPGHALEERGECVEHGGEIVKAMEELHAFGLAMTDTNFKNFVVTESGVRIIDLSCSGSAFMGRAKDAVRMELAYGLKVPVHGFLNRLAHLCVSLQQRIYYTIRNWRDKGKINLMYQGIGKYGEKKKK